MVFADAEIAAGRDELIDGLAHRRQGLSQPRELGGGVFGDNLPDRQPGLVQDRRPDRQPGVEPNADETKREHGAPLPLRHFQRVDEFASGREFGDDHRDRLQHLDLVLGIMPQRTVLHDEHTEHPAAAEDRHPH